MSPSTTTSAKTGKLGSKFFLPYQSLWIKDRSRLKLMEKSRQIGISWASAYEDVANTAPKGCRYDTWVSSRDEIQARLYLEDCRQFSNILSAGASEMGEEVLDAEKKLTAHAISFANSRRIHSMSSNPDGQAGKRGSRKLDEFALHPDPRKLYSIAYPGITWGGSLAIISTHRGSNNFFNKLIQEARHGSNPKGFSVHTVTLETALEQGFLQKLKAKLPPEDSRQEMDEADYFNFIKAGCADEETFQQEYMCVPSDDNSAFLTYDMITACEYPAQQPWEWTLEDCLRSTQPLYAGLDIGRSHDLTSFWLAEDVGGVLFVRVNIDLVATSFSQQEQILYPFFAAPNLRRLCIDATGLGMQFAERAQERHGSGRVEAVRFTSSVKEQLAYPLKARLEECNLRLPSSEKVRADLRAIKKVTTAANNVRFDADRGKNGHADRFWGLALMCHAAKHNYSVSKPVAFTRKLFRETIAA